MDIWIRYIAIADIADFDGAMEASKDSGEGLAGLWSDVFIAIRAIESESSFALDGFEFHARIGPGDLESVLLMKKLG